MTKKLVVLDPGHGGSDPGAIGYDVAGRQIRECDVTLAICQLMADRWVHSSDVVLTRRDDRTLSLDARVAVADTLNADIFLSVHCNSHTTPGPHGYEVFTTPGPTAADRLATDLYDLYGSRFPERRGRVDFRDGDPDKEARFRVLFCKAPAALFEVGFISNTAEASWLADLSSQREIADALAAGVWRYLRRA